MSSEDPNSSANSSIGQPKEGAAETPTHAHTGEDLRPKLMPLPRNMPEMKARLRALWEGEVPLFDTFWLYYFLIVFLLAALAGVGGMLGLLFSVVMLVWMAFMVRPIWKAADAYQGEKIWATLAKIIAILIAISAFSQLLRL